MQVQSEYCTHIYVHAQSLNAETTLIIHTHKMWMSAIPPQLMTVSKSALTLLARTSVIV